MDIPSELNKVAVSNRLAFFALKHITEAFMDRVLRANLLTFRTDQCAAATVLSTFNSHSAPSYAPEQFSKQTT